VNKSKFDNNGATLTPAEQDQLLALLQQLIRIPTEDPPGHEIEAASYVHDLLNASGVPAELNEFEPGRANVIGRIAGTGEKAGLVFSAHFDTMPVGAGAEAWLHAPFGGEIADGRVYGRGAGDMKGGMAAMLTVAQRIARDQIPLKGDLILALSAGESSDGLGAKQMVKDGSLQDAGALLISEPSSLNLIVAEQGALWLKAMASGTPGHTSGASNEQGTGDNAILKLVSLINQLQTFKLPATPHALLDPPSISIGTIQGGSAINLTPAYAELGLDIRYVPGQSAESILKTLGKLAGSEIHFEIVDDKLPFETPSDHPFVRLCQQSYSECVGRMPTLHGASYFTDAHVLSPAFDLPTVIVGPAELGMTGQRDEYVAIDKLMAAANLYLQIALDTLTK
jgi:succinyl-diaminopimelate desuccinylase